MEKFGEKSVIADGNPTCGKCGSKIDFLDGKDWMVDDEWELWLCDQCVHEEYKVVALKKRLNERNILS